ncbi:MAG TPA: DegV family protein [Ruminococcaceae bacterium]|nr:DegV family protein [Oscillospiraceae bacterium]
MAKVKIIADSGCDISKEDEARYGIDIMNFDITLGDRSIVERVTYTAEEFLELEANSEELPKTSQITVPRFEEKFRECVKEGYDDVIVVLINSTGSQTYANAVQAYNILKEEGGLGNTEFHIMDSHCYSLGYGYPVVEAARKLEAGQSCKMVLAFMEDWFNCCEIYIIGFNLRHMKKSGRISAAAAFLGEMLSLKPVISLIDGESRVVKKCRGEKAAVAAAAEYISERMIPETPWHLLTTTNPEMEELFQKTLSKKTGYDLTMKETCGGVVACNAGTNFIGVIVKGKARR